MKKILAFVLLAAMLVFALASCKADVMSYSEYMAAEMDEEVVIEAYVQATQSWWDNKITVYLADLEGAYFAYEMTCSESDAEKLVPGTKIRVSGTKTEYAGEVELASGATFEFVGDANDKYIAPAIVANDFITDAEQAIAYQNQLVGVYGAKIKAVAYKGGEPGDDIYVTVEVNGIDLSLCVERYLTGPDSDVYTTVGTLAAGDTVYVEGFLYWYNGVNTHITKIVKQ